MDHRKGNFRHIAYIKTKAAIRLHEGFKLKAIYIFIKDFLVSGMARDR